MSPRKIGMLVVVFAVLLGAVYLVSRPAKKDAASASSSGDMVFPGLDLNAVQAVTIAGPDGTGTLARKEGTWVVTGLYDYPVDFPELRRKLSVLGELKVGQVADDGQDMLKEFGLGERAAVVTLSSKDGSELATLTLGDSRQGKRAGPYGGGYPDGQYVRAGEGPVLLVAQTLGPFPADGPGWIKKQLLEVSSADVQHVAVFSTNGTYGIDFSDGPAMQGLADDEEIDTTVANRLHGALQYLGCVTVAGPADREGLGFSDPATFIAKTKDGIAHTVMLGESCDEGRYVRFSSAYAEPAEITPADAEALVPEPAEGAATSREELVEAKLAELKSEREEEIKRGRERLEELAHLGKWTYVISAYDADSMQLGRDQVVKKSEPAEEADAEGDSPPGA